MRREGGKIAPAVRGGREAPAPAGRRYGALLLATVIIASTLAACSITGSGAYQMVAYFRKTVSLYGQSDVRVLGMKVGAVQKVVTEGDRVKVTMTVKSSVNLPQGVRATLVPQSLLGARYVQLYPAWVDGEPRVDPKNAGQTVIGLDRTTIPAEPDEALAALKHLLDTLDPTATGRLVTNLNTDLAGNGQNLNDAVHSLSALSNTLADKDQQLVHLIDNLQQFTSVLDTREAQLGRVMDLFAQTTSLLAQERTTIAALVTNLAALSTNALDLISRHANPLQTDLANLSDLVSILDANLSNVSVLLSSLPELAAGPNLDSKAGVIAAYNPTYHRLDLRDALGATANSLLQALGLPLCLAIPLLAVQPQCAPGSIVIPAAAGTRAPAAAAVPGSGAAPGAVPRKTTPTTVKSLLPPLTLPPLTLPKLPPITLPNLAPLITPPKAVAAVQDLSSQGTASPLAAVLALLGSGGNTPAEVAGYGLSAPPPPPPRPSVVSRVARWSRHVLENLW